MKTISLKNNLSFITGASSGIGEAIAYRLASLGSNLIICARREDRLNDMAEKIRKDYGVEVIALTIDVSSIDSIKQSLNTVISKLDKLDILINNAGLALGRDKYHESNLDESIRVIRTNCEGLMIITKMLSPLILKGDNPHIINIGSIAGDEAYSGGAIYCATKAFVKTFTDGLRLDFMDTNVRITNIKPGLVETEFSNIRFRGDSSKVKSIYEGIDPLVAEDVADTIEFSVTRPMHFQVAEITLLATHQGNGSQIYRK